MLFPLSACRDLYPLRHLSYGTSLRPAKLRACGWVVWCRSATGSRRESSSSYRKKQTSYGASSETMFIMRNGNSPQCRDKHPKHSSPVVRASLNPGPHSTTSTQDQPVLRFVFFFELPRGFAGSRGCLRTSPLRRPGPTRRHFALSWPFVSPARPCGKPGSPQRPQTDPLKIKDLRADESSS